MARKTSSRLDKRREIEAAEARDGDAPPKKKAARKKATKRAAAPRKRAKAKATARKRLLWGVFSGSMKEEGRFPYHDRAAAEEKMEQLKTKSPKKLFFIQPIKDEITEPLPAAAASDAEE